MQAISDFGNHLLNLVGNAIEENMTATLPEETRQEYNSRMETVGKLNTAQLITLVGLIATVAFAALGILLAVAATPIIGTAIVIITLPVFWAAYNGYRLSSNCKSYVLNFWQILTDKIHENPSKPRTQAEFKRYVQSGGMKKDFKAYVRSGTFFAEPLLDCISHRECGKAFVET